MSVSLKATRVLESSSVWAVERGNWVYRVDVLNTSLSVDLKGTRGILTVALMKHRESTRL